MTAIERPLMKADGNPFHCSNCFYFDQTGKDNPYCGRRERQIRWNPVMFFCSDYGSKDEPITMQTKLDWRWS